jgi:predicted phosphoribosyltransferase
VAFPWRSRSPTIKVLRYRGDRPPLRLDGRIVVLADDGLATGYRARAAIEHIRGRGAIPPILGDRT